MMCTDCMWAAAHPVAAAEFDDEGHAKCRTKGQGRCTCQHRGTPYAINVDKDAKAITVHVHVSVPDSSETVIQKLSRSLRAGFPGRR
jgi:hypothetical protein